MQKFQEIWATVDGYFWLAVGLGITIKLMFSETLSKKQFALTIISGMFCAVFFPKPILHFLRVEGEHFEYAIVGLLALTGENLMRRIIKFSKDGNISDLKKGLGK